MPPRLLPLNILAHSATTALGAGLDAQRQALAHGRSGLRRNDFGNDPLDCWIGRVDGVEDVTLPPALAGFDCRNNALAWLALQQDGLLDALAAVVARHGAHRVAVVMGTSTSAIGATEAAYARLHTDEAGVAHFPPELQRPRIHTPHALGDFVRAATGLGGPCVTVATACSSSQARNTRMKPCCCQSWW